MSLGTTLLILNSLSYISVFFAAFFTAKLFYHIYYDKLFNKRLFSKYPLILSSLLGFLFSIVFITIITIIILTVFKNNFNESLFRLIIHTIGYFFTFLFVCMGCFFKRKKDRNYYIDNQIKNMIIACFLLVFSLGTMKASDNSVKKKLNNTYQNQVVANNYNEKVTAKQIAESFIVFLHSSENDFLKNNEKLVHVKNMENKVFLKYVLNVEYWGKPFISEEKEQWFKTEVQYKICENIKIFNLDSNIELIINYSGVNNWSEDGVSVNIPIRTCAYL